MVHPPLQELLNTVANLTEARLMITRELNNNKGPAVSEDSVLVMHREKEERKRMKMYLALQAREIAALKAGRSTHQTVLTTR